MSKVACVKCGALILESTADKNVGVCFPCKNGTRGAIEERKNLLASAISSPPEPEFICLECGSKTCRSEFHVNPVYCENNPWSLVASRVECWECGSVMPRELARRWNVDYEMAKEIWHRKYRNSRNNA